MESFLFINKTFLIPEIKYENKDLLLGMLLEQTNKRDFNYCKNIYVIHLVLGEIKNIYFSDGNNIYYTNEIKSSDPEINNKFVIFNIKFGNLYNRLHRIIYEVCNAIQDNYYNKNIKLYFI